MSCTNVNAVLIKVIRRRCECSWSSRGVLTALAPTVDESERAALEQAFACYLSTERGLSAATLRLYLPFVQRFLADWFG
jgi:hypothetical protein